MLFLLPVLGCSQDHPADTPAITQAAQPAVQVEKELSLEDFPLEQRLLFHDTEEQWQRNVFRQECLNPFGIKMNCMDCGEMLLEVLLQIDAEGNITSITGCGDFMYCHSGRPQKQMDAVKQCILESFSKVNLPAPFRGILLRARIGEVIGC